MSWTPRLRTVLWIVNVVILAMPLGAIAALRIYDSELVRQTEAELIAQGAFVEATYRNALLDELDRRGEPIAPHAIPAQATIETVDGKFIPVVPRLDVTAESIRPPAPDPIKAAVHTAEATLAAGARLQTILKEAQRITFAGIRVVDVQGTIVASTGDQQRGRSVAHHEEIQRALTGEFVSLLRERISEHPQPSLDSISRRTRVRVFVAMPVFIDERVVGAVVLSRTPLSISKALYDNRFVWLTMLLVLLAGVALITTLTLVTIQRPIRALIQQTRRIATERVDIRVIEHPGTREFEELSEAFASMATALGEREAYITTFARNVSHEFKTPLTSIRGAVELLQDHLDTMAPAERDEFLDVVMRDCERLDRLVGGMLDLARADVARPGAESADVTEVLRDVADQLLSADFSVEVQSGGALDVAMATESLESVLTNLLVNAREHGGKIANVTVAAEDEAAVITVSDDGPGIDADNASRVFDEFFTTARDGGGTGLGLAIVQTLVETHGGSVELVEPSTATFQLRLPRA